MKDQGGVTAKPKDRFFILGVSVIKKDLWCCVFFVTVWIIPIFYTGFTQQKIVLFPAVIRYIQSLSNLFILRTPVWPVPYIQVLPEGSDEWITLPSRDYFPMETFGYRTRLFELLFYATGIKGYEKKSYGSRAELADWIVERYAQLNKDKAELKAVRFTIGIYEVDPKSPPSGRWVDPPLESFSKDQTFILSTHVFNDNDIRP